VLKLAVQRDAGLLEHVAGVLLVGEERKDVAEEVFLVPRQQPHQQLGECRLHEPPPILGQMRRRAQGTVPPDSYIPARPTERARPRHIFFLRRWHFSARPREIDVGSFRPSEEVVPWRRYSVANCNGSCPP